MKKLDITTLVLLVIGGLNWGLVGFLNFDLVATIFGDGTAFARIVYVVVGISAFYHITQMKAIQNRWSQPHTA